MGRFAAASKQAASVVKVLKTTGLRSLGTGRNYTQALTRVCEYVKAEKIKDGLRGLSIEQAQQYLELRGQTVGQKTLDLERQAIQSMMRHVTGKLSPKETLPVIKSAHKQVLRPRAYTPIQVDLIKAAQTPHNALATALAYAAGLRAHELLTLRPITEQPIDIRPALESKWQGREGVAYSVKGKGGLIREVRLPQALVTALEQKRFQEPRTVTDRQIRYKQYYEIAGGKLWSNSFSAAAKRVLGRSTGAHGLRHSYAQERLDELQLSGLSQDLALTTVSQEMGHFRAEITETYLR